MEGTLSISVRERSCILFRINNLSLTTVVESIFNAQLALAILIIYTYTCIIYNGAKADEK